MRGSSVFLVIGGLALAGPAAAVDSNCWGVGGHLGTMVFPGAYPALWPNRINIYDVDDDGETDVGPAGNELETSLEKVRGDFIFGGQGYYWLDNNSRIGGFGNYIGGKGFSDVSLAITYDIKLVGKPKDTFRIYAGGALGFGSTTFKGLDNTGEVDATDDAEKLNINYFPARAEVMPFINLNNEWAIQPKLWGGLNIPSGHHWTVNGEEVEGVQGTLINYIAIGVEVGVVYGDFSPPKRNNNKGNNNNNKGGGGKGGKH